MQMTGVRRNRGQPCEAGRRNPSATVSSVENVECNADEGEALDEQDTKNDEER